MGQYSEGKASVIAVHHYRFLFQSRAVQLRGACRIRPSTPWEIGRIQVFFCSVGCRSRNSLLHQMSFGSFSSARRPLPGPAGSVASSCCHVPAAAAPFCFARWVFTSEWGERCGGLFVFPFSLGCAEPLRSVVLGASAGRGRRFP